VPNPADSIEDDDSDPSQRHLLHATTSSRVWAMVALCFFISGASVLAYEIVWSRLLTTFMGAGSYAYIIVLTTFFGGMAIGHVALGRLADRQAGAALIMYGVLELIIGAYGVMSPILYQWIERSYLGLVGGWGPERSLIAIKVAFAAGSLLIPTIAMGGTLPALARFVVKTRAHVGGGVGRLYAANTLGAAVGAAGAGLYTVPAFGALATLIWTGCINIVIGIGAVFVGWTLLAPRLRDDDAPETAAPTPTPDPTQLPPELALPLVGDVRVSDTSASQGPYPNRPHVLLIVAASVGCTALILQIAWIRVFAIVFGSSSQAFASMLCAFVLGISIGSHFASRWLSRRPDDAGILIRRLLAVAIVVILIQIPFYERLPFWQFKLAQLLERREDVYPLYVVAQGALAALWMLPVTSASGAILPSLVHLSTRSVGELGAVVGRLFATNTAGTLAGPFLAAFIFMPRLGLRMTIIMGAALLATAWALMLPAQYLRAKARWALVACATPCVLGLGWLLPTWDASVMHAGGFRRWTVPTGISFAEFREQRQALQVVFEFDGPVDSVVVLRNRSGEHFMKVNGKTDASDTPDLATQRLIAHIPLLLHRAAYGEQERNVFVVGVGSGVTVGSAALHPNTRVVAAEISSGVMRASAFFEHVDGGVDQGPHVHAHVADAREWLARDTQLWEIIINQPSNPWIAGNAALFSQEFFALARERLAPGGVMTQWMHVYAMDDDSIDLVLRTFSSVFPHVTLWWPNVSDLVMIGSMEPLHVDVTRLAALLADPSLAASLTGYPREGLRVTNIARFLAMQVLSEEGFRRTFTPTPPFTTDWRPRLEVRAPRAQFVGRESSRFVEIDERRDPSRPTALLWSQLAPADVDVEDLFHFFADRESTSDTRIAGSLAHAWMARDSSAAPMRDVALRATGLPGMFELWTDRIFAEDTPSRGTCESYADAARAALPARSSVFYRPDIEDTLMILDHCVEVYPQASLTLRATAAELLAHTGHDRRAAERIDAMLREPLPERGRALLIELRDGLRWP